MKIAILMTNTDETAFAQKHPKDGEKFQELLSPLRPQWAFSIFSVKDNVFPKDISAFDGLVITGSPASVHDGEQWIEKLFTLIRRAHAQAIPMYGACFGHQAIAAALGGKVESNPSGWIFGRVDTTLKQPWDNSTAATSLYAAHLEQVTVLPTGALATGTSEDCQFASFSIGSTIWTTQYHPEMTTEFVTALIEEYASVLPSEVVDTARRSLDKNANREAIASAIVQFFEAAITAKSNPDSLSVNPSPHL